MTESTPSGPAPGWYPDPKMAGTQRYWDGDDWSDHVAPLGAPPAANGSAGAGSGLVAAGIVTAFLIPIVGFILGIVVANKDSKSGTLIIVLSVLAGIGWFYFFVEQSSTSRY